MMAFIVFDIGALLDSSYGPAVRAWPAGDGIVAAVQPIV
jgi:hypothetical protein